MANKESSLFEDVYTALKRAYLEGDTKTAEQLLQVLDVLIFQEEAKKRALNTYSELVRVLRGYEGGGCQQQVEAADVGDEGGMMHMQAVVMLMRVVILYTLVYITGYCFEFVVLMVRAARQVKRLWRGLLALVMGYGIFAFASLPAALSFGLHHACKRGKIFLQVDFNAILTHRVIVLWLVRIVRRPLQAEKEAAKMPAKS